jgi:phage replication-related protein YjqB (UPF0714/DUF867 family)
MDRYSNFNELIKEQVENVDFEIQIENRQGARAVIIAPHGGRIEPGTDYLTRKIAGEEYSYYCFNGIKNEGNHDLHIKSHNFNEPRCLKILSSHSLVVAIHGCKGEHEAAYLGGRDSELKKLIHLEMIKVGIDSFMVNHNYMGEHELNICNRGLTYAGAQVELTMMLRKSEKAKRVVNAIKTALQTALNSKSFL